MVCVLQSKLPRSSAVSQLYCQLFSFFFFFFLFPPKPPRISHLLLLRQSFATALLHLCLICSTNPFFGGTLFIPPRRGRVLTFRRRMFSVGACASACTGMCVRMCVDAGSTHVHPLVLYSFKDLNMSLSDICFQSVLSGCSSGLCQ